MTSRNRSLYEQRLELKVLYSQDEAMARQQAKIELMRNANEERRLRFLDAPGRTMGINTQALDAQVALHQRNKEAAKESDRIDSEYLELALLR